MLDLLRRHKLFFIAATLAGLALRLLFVFRFAVTSGDTLIYGDIAKNWLAHGIFGITQPDGRVLPTLIRLPGYPAFLAICFQLFGREHYNAVRFTQVALDLLTCLVVADLARRTVSPRAARAAFLLAALCPFTANYVALPLTETLAILCAAAALWSAVRVLEKPTAGRALACGVVVAYGILLRPDGGILLAAIGAYWLYKLACSHEVAEKRRLFSSGVLIAVVALAPLGPWALRNWRTMHVWQPLAPRYANDPNEFVPLGFERWTKTWMADYVSVAEVYWKAGSETIDVNLLPNRAFDSPAQRQETAALIDRYNEVTTVTPQLDADFARLAAERIRHHRLRYYVWLPALRIADMWLRPRTEMLGLTDRWWSYADDPEGAGRATAYGALNVVFLGLACYGVRRWRNVRYAGLLIVFVVLRSLFLGTLENPEPRYTLEMFPVVLVFAAVAINEWTTQSGGRPVAASH